MRIRESNSGVASPPWVYTRTIDAQKRPSLNDCFTRLVQNLLFASQTALDDVRVIGACLKNQLVAKIGQGKRTFFVGIDTSSRGGSLGAYVISSQDEKGKIEHAFYGFDRPSSGSAEMLADGLLAVVDVLTKSGGIFGGFGSDAPATMVGALNGVAAHVMAKVGYVRHDTCEFHASARVLAILEKVFPGQMNEVLCLLGGKSAEPVPRTVVGHSTHLGKPHHLSALFLLCGFVVLLKEQHHFLQPTAQNCSVRLFTANRPLPGKHAVKIWECW